MSNAVTIHPGDALDVMAIVRDLMQRPDFSIDMLKELLALRQQAEQRQSDRDFQFAFARCQGNVTRAKRDEDNPIFKSKYASIEAMYDAVWPAVMAEGFDWTVSAMPIAPEGWDNSVLWFQGTLSRDIAKRTVELPVSRDALKPEGPKGGRPAMNPTQALGALTTYMRKYLLGIMFSVVTEDDVRLDNDGNRQAPRDRPPGGPRKPPDALDERDPAQWVKNLEAAIRGAQSRQEVIAIEHDPRVVEVYERKATQSLKDYIDDLFRNALARFSVTPKPNGEAPDDRREEINREVPLDPPTDPAPDPSLDKLAELTAEVETMDLITIGGLQTNAQWRQKIRDAELFPPDMDTLNEAIDARKAALQQGRT